MLINLLLIDAALGILVILCIGIKNPSMCRDYIDYWKYVIQKTKECDFGGLVFVCAVLLDWSVLLFWWAILISGLINYCGNKMKNIIK